MNCGRTNQVNFFSSFLATISLHFFCECNCFYSDNQLQWKPINCVKCSRCLLLFCRFIRNIFSCLLFRLSIKFILRFGSWCRCLLFFCIFLADSKTFSFDFAQRRQRSSFSMILLWFRSFVTISLDFLFRLRLTWNRAWNICAFAFDSFKWNN